MRIINSLKEKEEFQSGSNWPPLKEALNQPRVLSLSMHNKTIAFLFLFNFFSNCRFQDKMGKGRGFKMFYLLSTQTQFPLLMKQAAGPSYVTTC